METENTF